MNELSRNEAGQKNISGCSKEGCPNMHKKIILAMLAFILILGSAKNINANYGDKFYGASPYGMTASIILDPLEEEILEEEIDYSGFSSGFWKLTGEPTGPSAYKRWDVIEAGESVAFKVASPDVGISRIVMSVASQSKNAEIGVISLSARPSSVQEPPKEVYLGAFKFIELRKRNLGESAMSSATIEFKVDKSWIASKKAQEDSVVLLRWTGSRWQELPTRKISSSNTYASYSATTSGFSYFAITAKVIAESKKQDTVAARETPVQTDDDKVNEPQGMQTDTDDKTRWSDLKPEEKSKFSFLVLAMSVLIGGMLVGGFEVYRVKSKRQDKLVSIARQHIVHFPHDDLERIERYITAARQYGYPDANIYQLLIEAGWQTQEIDESFVEVGAQTRR